MENMKNMWDEVKGNITNKVWFKVENRVAPSVWREVRDKARNATAILISDKIWSRLILRF